MKKSKQESKLPLDFVHDRHIVKIRKLGRYYFWQASEQGSIDGPYDVGRCVSVENAHRAAKEAINKFITTKIESQWMTALADNYDLPPWEYIRNVDWDTYYGSMDDDF